jgi:hypothetical protein
LTSGQGFDDRTVQQLLDEQSIRKVLARYCRGIDRLDRELVRSCYHPDAIDSHAGFEGTVDEFIAYAWRLLSRFSMTMHFLGSTLVEFADDRRDLATAETYGIAFHRSEGGRQKDNWASGFRYVDRFERRVDAGGELGEWRIARRVVAAEWMQVDSLDLHLPFAEGVQRGRRDPSDPVYHVLD